MKKPFAAKSRSSALGIGFIALVAGLFAGFVVYRLLQVPKWSGRPIPQQGLVLNPDGKVLGDPSDAERDFRKVYLALDAFRRRHQRLPELKELLDFGKPISDGIQLTRSDFVTPDRHRSDHYLPTDQTLEYALNYAAPRPDGKRKPAFPPPGEKDVWLYCSTYARMNQKVHRDYHSELTPQGFYIVLWSTGEIERVPVMKMLASSDGRGTFEHTFKGQAGLSNESVVDARSLLSVERKNQKDTFNRVSIPQ